jgi:hypothetical protein
LTLLSAATSPPAFLTAFVRASPDLVRPSSRAKNATVVSGGSAGERGATSLDVGVLPALDAVDDHEAPADRERHRAQRRRDRLGRRGVALEDLDAARPLSASAIARSRARRSAMRPWSSPWMR